MENVRGLILETLDYREKEKILRVYTRENGKLSLIIKKKSGNHLLLEPLSETEFIFKRHQGTLHPVKDASLINPRFHLRKNLSTLQSAGKLLQIILRSQLEEIPSPLLYQLLISYLDHLAESPNLPLLIASFQLKLLKHEGFIGDFPPPNCSYQEWEGILSLINTRSFAALYQTPNALPLIPLTDHLFTSLQR